MKRTTFVMTFLLTTLLCFGQKEHLEPEKDFNQYDGVLKEYYDHVFPLLYNGFSQKPYARYTSSPSFSEEYAFSVEKIKGKCYILSNRFSENYWYADKKESVKVKTSKTEITNDLYLQIGTLFELLTEQTKEKERKIKVGANGEIIETVAIGLDGTTYSFTTTDKNGEIRTGTTWSPRKNSMFAGLVKICDDLCSIGIDKNISQTKILKEIELLIHDFKKPRWELVWEDDFEINDVIDVAVWSKIPRGRADWCRHMSDYDALYDVKNGNLILRGMVNPGLPGDTMPFVTGGIYTKDKKSFYHGKIEIRAKLGNAQGAWPAFWLLPFDNEQWPYGGEIDIMERLNGESIAYQTVHSHYTYNLKQNEPVKGTTAPIHKDDYNIYGVELYPDSLVFSINGTRTFNYPRIETDKEGQFPFDRSFYLMLDMQLGGSWVGRVEPNDLPVEMYIDWVRFYEWK